MCVLVCTCMHIWGGRYTSACLWRLRSQPWALFPRRHPPYVGDKVSLWPGAHHLPRVRITSVCRHTWLFFFPTPAFGSRDQIEVFMLAWQTPFQLHYPSASSFSFNLIIFVAHLSCHAVLGDSSIISCWTSWWCSQKNRVRLRIHLRVWELWFRVLAL